ncbi:hypothetical protein ACA910_001204 [Epithemia clementina (nom. ined.)]
MSESHCIATSGIHQATLQQTHTTTQQQPSVVEVEGKRTSIMNSVYKDTEMPHAVGILEDAGVDVGVDWPAVAHLAAEPYPWLQQVLVRTMRVRCHNLIA